MNEKLITAGAATFTDEQRKLITDVLCKGGTPTEVSFFMQVAERLNLDPFRRQIHAMKRYDSTLERDVLQFMVSIEGLRSIASRCKTDDGKDAYAGSSKPQFTWKDDNSLDSAEVTVYRIVQGEPRQFTAEVFYDECVQMRGVWENRRKVGEEPNSMWTKRPRGQLGKCAEAAALRKAFPEETGGVYIEEEAMNTEHEQQAKPEGKPLSPTPKAEGMAPAAATEATVLPPEKPKVEARHWSELMLENGYQMVVMGEGMPFAGSRVWEVVKENFEQAYKEVPREDTVERHALDCAYFLKIKASLARKGYDLDEATAVLRSSGFLAHDAEITEIKGDLLTDLAEAVRELKSVK